jgi:hypothetical protein
MKKPKAKPKKKPAPRKDQSQIALSVVERAIGEKLSRQHKSNLSKIK